MPDALISPGEVWLVGAGPGDPELLTLKALRLIESASIVCHDALVGPDVLDLIPDHVVRVFVGKRSGRHSKDQRSINGLLVDAAKAGHRVVRLKGGDPGVFGRAAEEIGALRAHGIAVFVCPGITTASAAAAACGMSLTLRGTAEALTFVTAHARAGARLDIDWTRLADPRSTLAIYMGRGAAREVSCQLIAAGLAGDTPTLIACSVSLPGEKLLKTRLDLLPLAIASFAGNVPTLILIGNAVNGPDEALAVLPRMGTADAF